VAGTGHCPTNSPLIISSKIADFGVLGIVAKDANFFWHPCWRSSSIKDCQQNAGALDILGILHFALSRAKNVKDANPIAAKVGVLGPHTSLHHPSPVIRCASNLQTDTLIIHRGVGTRARCNLPGFSILPC
jgi:hypothetical protein